MVKRKTFVLSLACCAAVGGVHVHAQNLFGATNPALHQTTGLETYAQLGAFGANDILPLKDYISGWNGPYTARAGTNTGLAVAHWEAGAAWENWRIGLVRRGEAFATTSPDTSDLFHQYANNTGYTAGRSYGVDYTLRGFEAQGVRLSRSHALWDAAQSSSRWGWSVSLLQGTRIKMEDAKGQAVTISAQDFNAQLTHTSDNSATDTSGNGAFNPPYGRQAAWSGQGYSVDAGWVLQRKDGLRLEASVHDLWGTMDWRNLPRIESTYNTSNKYFDSNGFVHFNPTATSVSSYANQSVRMEPKWKFAAEQTWDDWGAGLAVYHLYGLTIPELSASYACAAQCRFSTSWESRFNTVGFSLRYRFMELGLRSSDWFSGSPRAIGLSAGLNIRF